MSFNINQEITDYKGKPLLDEDKNKLTFGDALITAANNGGLQTESTKDKTTRFLLASRIAAAMTSSGEITLTSSEIVLLRDSTARIYSPLILGRLTELIDPESLKD